MFKKSSTAPPSRGTILFVDDEAVIRTFGQSVLLREGYTVLLANNAAAAIKQAHQHEGTIDLLVTDIVLPRMDGFVLGARLAKIRPAIKLLWMSGYSETSSSVHEELVKSKVPFLAKPFSPEDLVRKVWSTLAQPNGNPPHDRD